MAEDGDDFERVAMIQRLKPDRVDDYLEAHEDVPGAVSEAMERGGVRQFQLFVQGDLSIGYFEVEDLEEFNEEYMNDPRCQEWEERVGEFKQSGVDVDEGSMPTMDHVWSFEADDA
jgi:L-rhamnose mutarotase